MDENKEQIVLPTWNLAFKLELKIILISDYILGSDSMMEWQKKNGGIFNVYLAASITNLSNTRANIEILAKLRRALHLSVATNAFERKISP